MARLLSGSGTIAGEATQVELDLKANKASPAFSGTPTGITAAHIGAGVLPSDVTGGAGLTSTIGTLLLTKSTTTNNLLINQSDNATLFTSAYHTYMIIMHNYTPDTASELTLRFEATGGGIDTDGYGYNLEEWVIGTGASSNTQSSSSSRIPLELAYAHTNAYNKGHLVLYINNPELSDRQQVHWTFTFIQSTGNARMCIGHGVQDTSIVVTGLQFVNDQDDYVATFKVYGLN